MKENSNKSRKKFTMTFSEKPLLPPLNERQDSYSQTKLKTEKLLKILRQLR